MNVYVALVSLQETMRKNRLSLPDMPGYARDNGFCGIEILDRQLKGNDRGALRALQRACGLHACTIVLDANSDLTHSSPMVQQAEIDHLREIIDLAVALECSVVRITLGGQALSVQKLWRGLKVDGTHAGDGSATKAVLSSALVRRAGHTLRALWSNVQRLDCAKLNRAVEALHRVLPYAEKQGVSLAIENHWGISARPEWILRVVEAAQAPNIGTCPDFGNFPTRIDRYTALADLAPRALHVQAKCWRFDSRGEETSIDFGRCLALLRSAGYRGPISIEYEGGKNELASCIAARDLILRNI